MSAAGSDGSARRARAGHGDEETRYRAVGELDPRDAGDRLVLLERLGDPSWRVRAAAVERIASRPDAGVVPPLVQLLAAGPGAGAREAAAGALARIGTAALPALVDRLANAADPDLRQAAAAVLGAIRDARAVPPLTARLADPDPNVRSAAAEALGSVGGAAAVAALLAAVESDDATLRLTAIEALCAVGGSLPVERIEALLAERALRRPLYRLLGASDDPAALALVAGGLVDPARAGREAALGALGRQRVRRTAAELAPVIAAARDAAARDPGLADAWAAALGCEERPVAIGALTALAACGVARHVGAMVRLAEDEPCRVLVEEALDALPPGPELRTALADALPSLGPLARLTALSCLARLGSPAAFEAVVREASDRDSHVQAEAIGALGRLRDACGVAPLAGRPGPDDPAIAGLASAARVHPAGAAGTAAAGALAALARAGPGGGEGHPLCEAAVRRRPAGDALPMSEEEFRLLRDLVRAHCGIWFRDEARYLLERRLAPRLQALGVASYADYHRFLRLEAGGEAELDEAVDLLTTNETYFYREPPQLEAFARELLPRLARARSGERRLRILSAGCSTGEEAYTLAVLVKESRLFERWGVEVVGCDISRRCLARACAGAYGEHAFRLPEAEPMRRWFHRRDGKWAIDDAIREMVRFGRENLLDPPPPSEVARLDVVFCRNVMIYFDLPARKQVLRTFHSRLRDGGWLLLGHSESLINVTADFEIVQLESDLVYRKPDRACREARP